VVFLFYVVIYTLLYTNMSFVVQVVDDSGTKTRTLTPAEFKALKSYMEVDSMQMRILIKFKQAVSAACQTLAYNEIARQRAAGVMSISADCCQLIENCPTMQNKATLLSVSVTTPEDTKTVVFQPFEACCLANISKHMNFVSMFWSEFELNIQACVARFIRSEEKRLLDDPAVASIPGDINTVVLNAPDLW
jgi:hypothetical protein